MQVKLLGSGSAEGWPGLFCKCRVCCLSRQVRGKNLRTRASAIIDGTLKIDLPPDTLSHVHSFDLDMREVELLLFTHAHDDHLAEKELQYLSWMFLPSGDTSNLRIAGSETVLNKIRQSIDTEQVPLTIEPALRPWETRQIGDWSITPVIPNHDPSQICFNHIIEREGKRLLYATDTGWYSESTWSFLKSTRLDAIVVEASKGPILDGYEGHLAFPQVIEFINTLRTAGCISMGAPVVTTHHCHLGGMLHDEMVEILEPSGIQVGYDGMIFDV